MPLSLFQALQLYSSLVRQLWSRVRVKGISHTHMLTRTHKDVALLGLNAAEGVEVRPGFSHANSYLLAVFETAGRRPPLPSGSPSWPLASGPEAASPPLLWHSMGCVCMYVCVNGQSQLGFCHSVISLSATSLNIAGCQPLAQGKSSVFQRQTVIFPSVLKTLLISLMLHFSISFLKVTALANISFCLFFLPPPVL